MKTYSFFDRSIFSKRNVTLTQLNSIIKKIKFDIKHSKCTTRYKQLLTKKYHEFDNLRKNMIDKGIQEIPLNIIEKISGSN